MYCKPINLEHSDSEFSSSGKYRCKCKLKKIEFLHYNLKSDKVPEIFFLRKLIKVCPNTTENGYTETAQKCSKSLIKTKLLENRSFIQSFLFEGCIREKIRLMGYNLDLDIYSNINEYRDEIMRIVDEFIEYANNHESNELIFYQSCSW